MKIVFLSATNYAYDPRTPLVQPLGGTESAVAYLTAALARAGAKVTLLNNCPVERNVDGVHIAHNHPILLSNLEDCDLLVVVSAAIGGNVRRFLDARVPLVLWCHLDIDQQGIFGLGQPEERAAWTRYVMVSKWQAERFAKHYSLPESHIHVIGNGVSPAFLARPPAPAWFEAGAAPTLAYTSTPFRGLDILLQCFPAIREAIPDIRLRVHSSMNIYGIGSEADAYRYLYKLARSLPGVDYVGPVSQSELAQSLQSVAAIAYPSTFRETSCIAVMEAMASGVDIITTDLGALPETLNGFGQALSSPETRSISGTNPVLANGFIDLAVKTLLEARSNPAGAAQKRRERVDFARSAYNWDARAQEWLALAEKLKSA